MGQVGMLRDEFQVLKILLRLQEEILWLAEAAHLPVIWATQVLENMAKRGQPSRAEISDAAMGKRAECVMLNKGPRILEAIASLADIVLRMEAHEHKKRAMLRKLHWRLDEHAASGGKEIETANPAGSVR